jgi:hypothetical protein
MADNSPSGMPVCCSILESALHSGVESPCNALNGNEWWQYWEYRQVFASVPITKFQTMRQYRDNQYNAYSPEWVKASMTFYKTESVDFNIDFTDEFVDWDGNDIITRLLLSVHDVCYFDATMPTSPSPDFSTMKPSGGHYPIIIDLTYTGSASQSTASFFNYYNCYNGNMPMPYLTLVDSSSTSLHYKWFYPNGSTDSYADYTLTVSDEYDYSVAASFVRSQLNISQSAWSSFYWSGSKNGQIYQPSGGFGGAMYPWQGYDGLQTSPIDYYVSCSGHMTQSLSGVSSPAPVINSVGAAYIGLGMPLHDGSEIGYYGAAYTGISAQHSQYRYKGQVSQSYVLVEIPAMSVLSGSHNVPYKVIGSGMVGNNDIIDIPPNSSFNGACYIKDFGGGVGSIPIYQISTYLCIQDDPNAPPSISIGAGQKLERITDW